MKTSWNEREVMCSRCGLNWFDSFKPPRTRTKSSRIDMHSHVASSTCSSCKKKGPEVIYVRKDNAAR